MIRQTFKLDYDNRVRQAQENAIVEYLQDAVANGDAEIDAQVRPLDFTEKVLGNARWPMKLYHAIFAVKDNISDYNVAERMIFKMIVSFMGAGFDGYFDEISKTVSLISDAERRGYNKGYSKGREAGIREADEMIDRLIMDGTLLKVAKRLEGITPEQMALLNKMAGGSSTEKSLVKQLLDI